MHCLDEGPLRAYEVYSNELSGTALGYIARSPFGGVKGKSSASLGN